MTDKFPLIFKKIQKGNWLLKRGKNREFMECKAHNELLLEHFKKENCYIVGASPTFIGLGTDEICNLECIMCIQRLKSPEILKNTHPIEEKYLIKFAEQVFPTAKILRLNTSGEPLMSRRLDLELELAEKYEVKIEVITNGTLLNKRNLFQRIVKIANLICFSFDSPVKKTYESIRINSDYREVVNNMRLFQKHRNAMPLHERPAFVISMVLMRTNLPEVLRMVKFAKYIGADSLNISRMIVFTKDMEDESLDNCKEEANKTLLTAQEFAARLQLNLAIPPLFNLEINSLPEKTLENKGGHNGLSKRCPFLWDRVYIDGNADIFPCCEPSHPVVGSIKDKSFVEIWNGKIYQAMRQTFTGGPYYKLCKDCAEHGYLSKTNP